MAEEKSDPCKTVAQGGVGESGASSLVHHQLGAGPPRLAVLRRTESNLCPNTGAVAVLLVNGAPRAFGDITASGSLIQAEATADDHVVGIVHTVPLFNDILCVTLGELRFDLDVCDLVGATAGTTTQLDSCVPCTAIETRDWAAWNNQMPPKPDDFHIVGEVAVPNPGVDAYLVPRIPQGPNPQVLFLDLVLIQRAGIWPRVITWKPVRYDKVLPTADYEHVDIFCDAEIIAHIDVETVS